MRGMNKLPLETRVQILTMLVEGRPCVRSPACAGVSINTVTKLLVDAGGLRGLSTMRRCAASTPSPFSATKFGRSATPRTRTSSAKSAPDGAGDVWTWTAHRRQLQADRFLACWRPQPITGMAFIGDLQARLANRVQLTTDGHKAYLTAVEDAISMPTTRC